MHIVIDARVIGSSTGTVVDRLLHHLQHIDAANRYTVLIDRGDDACWRPEAPNFRKLLIDVPHHSIAEQTRLRRIIGPLKPDLVHYCMPQQPLLARGRVVTTIHDLIILRNRNPHRNPLLSIAKRAVGWLAFIYAARKSDRVITVSEYSKGDIVTNLHVDADKVRVIYNAVDAPRSVRKPGSGAHPYLLYVGRLPEYKNVQALCEAHQRLLDVVPNLRLVLVGRIDRDAARLQAHCERNGYRNIDFTGFVSDRHRDELYAGAAAYVFPSLAEGFGLPGLEAMAQGAPVVSSNATCLPEIYGDAALFFDPTDGHAMVTAIRRVLEDEPLRAELIRRGHARAQLFSWRRMAEETHALYLEVLGLPA